jgi:Zn-dependent M32 family carboxypeptidase
MNMRVATSLMAAIAIAISTGSFAGRNACAAQVDEQENIQQSQHKMESKAAEIGKKLDELEQKMKTSKEEAKTEMSRQMVELRKLQKKVQMKLQEMKIASGKAWQDAKEGAQSTMDDLQKAYEKARARFSNKTE